MTDLGERVPGNVGLIKGAYAAFARGDLAAVLAIFDPKIAWSEASGFPTVGGTHVGPQAVAAVLGRVAAEWDGLTVTPDQYVSEGDTVIALGETQGRHRATGKYFRSRFAHEWRLSNGRITEWRAHIDTALAQMAAKGGKLASQPPP
jgi:uncharacterized protein